MCCGTERLSRQDKNYYIFSKFFYIFMPQLLSFSYSPRRLWYALAFFFFYSFTFSVPILVIKQNISTRTFINGRWDYHKIDCVHPGFQKENSFLLLLLSWINIKMIFTNPSACLPLQTKIYIPVHPQWIPTPHNIIEEEKEPEICFIYALFTSSRHKFLKIF